MDVGSKVEKEWCARVVKSFLDVLILGKLENSESMGGYDFVRFIHREFGILISTGLIYSNLYRLERKGFIRGYSAQKSKVYKISDEGKEYMSSARHAAESVHRWIERMMRR